MGSNLRDLLQELAPPVHSVDAEVVELPPVDSEVDSEAEAVPESPKVVAVGGRRWWLVAAGLGLSALAFVGIFSFGASRNMGVGFISVLALFGGAFLAYYGYKKKDEGFYIDPQGKKTTIVANCINIYEDRVVFEHLEPHQIVDQQPHKLRNDGKYYYMHLWGTAWGRDLQQLVQFRLPDTQYRSPRVFADNINLPAHRRLAQRKASLLEQLSPWILIVGMGAVAFLWVLVSNPG